MWIKQENELTFTASPIEALNEIPVGNWLVKFSPTKGYFLEKSPEFRMPKKIYGDSEKLAERYLNTFKNRNNNLGILLTGLKGTGKSITAKITCKNSNLPVILITEAFTGDAFKSFLSNITQPVIVFIDEFEKVYYDVSLQNSFLSILDGIFEGKKLFLFTSNEKKKINEYLINRPGRVHYLKEYNALEDSLIHDVIDDNLVIKEHKEELMDVIGILTDVTMDMLISLIGEMNLYKEPARESIRLLNLRPESKNFEVEVFNKNNVKIGTGTIGHHPLVHENLHVEIYCSDILNYKGGASNHDNIVATIVRYYQKSQIEASKNKAEIKEVAMEKLSSEDAEYMDDSELIKHASSITEEFAGVAELADLKFTPDALNAKNTHSSWVNYNLDIKELKVLKGQDDIKIVDDFGNTFKFKKAKTYTFTF